MVVNLTSLQAAVYIVNRYKGLFFFLNKDLIACNMRLQTKTVGEQEFALGDSYAMGDSGSETLWDHLAFLCC